MKKRILAMLLIGVMMLTACSTGSGLSREEKKNLKNYSEWADAVGLEDIKTPPADGFSDSDGISVGFAYSKSYDTSESTSNIMDMIQKHNEFVEEHPDYFGDQDIDVYATVSGGLKAYEFSDYINSYCEGMYDLDQYGFDQDKTGALTIAFFNLENAYYGVMPEGFDNDFVETLILDFGEYNLGDVENYDISFIGKFSALKNVAFCFCPSDGKEQDCSALVKSIESEYPDVKVYICQNGKNGQK